MLALHVRGLKAGCSRIFSGAAASPRALILGSCVERSICRAVRNPKTTFTSETLRMAFLEEKAECLLIESIVHPYDPLCGEDLASVVKQSEGMRFAMGNSAPVVQRGARTGSNLAYLIVENARLGISFKFCLKLRFFSRRFDRLFAIDARFLPKCASFAYATTVACLVKLHFPSSGLSERGARKKIGVFGPFGSAFFSALRLKTGINFEKPADLSAWQLRRGRRLRG